MATMATNKAKIQVCRVLMVQHKHVSLKILSAHGANDGTLLCVSF